MGTRGFMGWIVDGKLGGSYNHFDSYPAGLGAALVEDCLKLGLPDAPQRDRIADLARNMRAVGEQDKPTAEDKRNFADLTDKGVSMKGEDWYSVLREMQGRLALTFEVGVYCDHTGFVKDSLFCEYGYVVDFTRGALILLRGFNQNLAKQWKFAKLTPEEVEEARADAKKQNERWGGSRKPYYGVVKIGEISFDDPDFGLDKMKALYLADDAETYVG